MTSRAFSDMHALQPYSFLRRGTEIVAILGAIVDAFLLTITFYNFFSIFNSPTPEYNNTTIAIYIAVIVVRQIGIVLSVFLFVGAKKNDHQICRSWLLTTLTIFVIDTVSYIMYLKSSFHFLPIVECAAITAFRLIQMAIVYTFMHHMEFLNKFR